MIYTCMLSPGAERERMAIWCEGPVRCGRQLAVLLSADSVAMGIWLDGHLELHKVLTGYTVRRKSGMAQLTHLRRCAAPQVVAVRAARSPWKALSMAGGCRGGSGGSVGGAIRYRQVQRLFHAAAAKLCSWQNKIELCDKVWD